MKRLRGWGAVLFFVLFGLGAAVLSYAVLPFVRGRGTALRLVRAVWRVLLAGFEAAGLIRIDRSALAEPIRGSVIVANHPSLIDVVILTALLPRTFSVAKHALRVSPLLGPIVRKVFLPDDETLLDEAGPLLSDGCNILVFPEGTRSPGIRTMHSWHRGAVQLALRTGAPVRPLALRFGYRILGKGQPVTDMGPGTVPVAVVPLAPIPAPDALPAVLRPEAVRRTRLAAEAVQAVIGGPH